MNRRHAVIESPVGPLTLVDDGDRVAGLYLRDQRHRPDPLYDGDRDDRVLPAAQEQLVGYFAGDLTGFTVPLTLAGTPFQQRVWAALQAIPYGQTRSYGEIAAAIGQPAAVRAVGLANGRNPVAIIVPCHRVVGAGGALTGYGGGLERKRALLDHERGDRLW